MTAVDQKTKDLIARIVAERADGLAVTVTKVEPDVDDLGDDILSVEFKIPYSKEPFDTEKMLDIRIAIDRALQAHGDNRYIVSGFDFDDRQEIKRVRRAS